MKKRNQQTKRPVEQLQQIATYVLIIQTKRQVTKITYCRSLCFWFVHKVFMKKLALGFLNSTSSETIGEKNRLTIVSHDKSFSCVPLYLYVMFNGIYIEYSQLLCNGAYMYIGIGKSIVYV